MATVRVTTGAHRVPATRRRIAAIERIAWTAQVVDRCGIEEHARRIGEGSGKVRKCRAGGLEQLDLRPVERVAWDLGRDEMAHQQIGAACCAVRLHRGFQLSEGLEAQSVHARVEMDRAAADPVLTRGEGGPALKLLFTADRRGEPIRCIIRWLGAALEAIEHIDLSLRRQRLPRRDPLTEMGDKKNARARSPQRRRGFGNADPVSISLDDGGAAPRRRATCERAPVVGQRAKVDREASRRARGRDRVRQAKRSWVPNLHSPM